MRLALILTAIFIFFHGCLSRNGREENPIKVELPSGKKELKDGKNLVVTVDENDKIYIGNSELPSEQLDSLLRIEISKIRKNVRDSITVILNVDTASSYGIVFRVMRAAKKEGAKVVARVEN
jgi:biopolymer transport protein ExbD